MGYIDVCKTNSRINLQQLINEKRETKKESKGLYYFNAGKFKTFFTNFL